MAKGYWRNWEEINCPKCGIRIYKKDLKKHICKEKEMKEKCVNCVWCIQEGIAVVKVVCSCPELILTDHPYPEIKLDDNACEHFCHHEEK